ncbi:MAG: kelch repeat-containing protein, partial [Candidatus Poribacteria bacterium]
RWLNSARSLLREEMLTMMGETFEHQKLPTSFTFRIVEIIKRIRPNPISTMKGLPWGLSLATGLIITIMSFNPSLISFTHVGTSIFSPLPVESKVLKIGEIPVDVVKTSNISFISSDMGKGKGGELKPDMQNAFMAPQGEGGEWLKKADMPTARVDMSSAVVDGKVYVMGGFAVACGPATLSVVEEYNPTTDTWTKKADMPTARAALSSVAVKGKIYAIGGTPDNNAVLSTVEEYDPVANKWTKKTDMPTARDGLSTIAVNGKIYAIGGYVEPKGPILSTVEEYNPETDTWTKKADMPTPRWYHSSSVVGGKIYVVGGFPRNNAVLSTVEEYDPATDKWTKKADMPTARAAHSASVSGGRIYAFGGTVLTTSVEEYSPVTDTWIKKADMPTGRLALTASEVNGKIYVIGGIAGAVCSLKGLSTIEEYTPDGWQSGQAVSPQGKLPSIWGKLKSR